MGELRNDDLLDMYEVLRNINKLNAEWLGTRLVCRGKSIFHSASLSLVDFASTFKPDDLSTHIPQQLIINVFEQAFA